MKLIICEKPQIGKAIASILPGNEKRGAAGSIEKDNYIIVSCIGHLLQLKSPDEYDIKYKQRNLEDLPIYFEDWQLRPKEEHAERVKVIGQLLKNADGVIHAGDVDDEGQLLIDELLRYFEYKGVVERIDTSSLTEGDLRKAFSNMKDNKEFINDGWAAYARSVADFVIGINMSRYFSCNNPGHNLTVGRVQSPTLGLVVNRDALIEGHEKVFYFNVHAMLEVEGNTIESVFVPGKEDNNLENGKILRRAYAEEILAYLQGKRFSNVLISKDDIFEKPPLPFNLVKLQTHCSKSFGYNPSEVMKITQSLREKYKAITYNRSDCQYLSNEHYKEAPTVISSVISNMGYNLNITDMIDFSLKRDCFNDDLVTAHHAIIPTDVIVDIKNMTEQECNVYKAICTQYCIQFLPSARKSKTSLNVELGKGAILKSESIVMKEPGYRELYSKKEKSPSILSDMPAGIYDGMVAEALIKEMETKPPARYTQTTLNEDMTRISKYVSNPMIKKLLLDKDKGKKGENGSIGTTATRATIIETLIKRGFLEEKGKQLISTPLGRELYRILPNEVKKPDVTALWWAIQEDVKKTGNYKLLTNNVLQVVKKILTSEYPKIDAAIVPMAQHAINIGICPRCSSVVIATRKGYFCKNEECHFAMFPNMRYFENELSITSEKAKALLQPGGKALFKLEKKDGNKYDGYLKIKLNGEYVNFESAGFPKRKWKKGKK